MNRIPVRLPVAAGGGLLAVFLLTSCTGADHPGTGGGHDRGAMPTGTASVPAATAPAAAASSGTAFNGADVAFATGMIPHHRQAIEMADLAGTRAGDAQVKELAAQIRRAQDPEIATMSGWLRQWGQPVPSAAPGMGHGGHGGASGMMTAQEMNDLRAASGTGFDRMFLQMMIRHHEGAIDMARLEQQQGQHPQATGLAATIATDQAAEINRMRDLLGKL
jgi:uncharacterized protein (DUF305 family)